MNTKQSIRLLTLSCLAAFSTQTSAESAQGYYGIGYHIAFRAGGYLNQVIAIDARLALGISDDTIRTNTISNVNIELDTALSVFIKADVPVTPFVNAYGLLGLTRGEIETSSIGLTASESETGLSYGLGIEGEINRRTYLSVEYVQYLDEDSFEYSGINFGITTRF